MVCGGKQISALNKFEKKIGVQIQNKKEITDNSEQPAAATTLTIKEAKHVCIWFSARVPGGRVVAHEALHATLHVLRRSGIDYGKEEVEEVIAYFLDWLVGKIGRKIW